MATIPFTVTTGTPALEITTGPLGISYHTILELLNGTYAFTADEIYYHPEHFNQFGYPLSYRWFSMNADTSAQMISTFIDPMDFLPVQFVRTKDRDMLFNGQSYLSLKLLPLETVQLYFMGRDMYLTRVLGAARVNNFKGVADKIGHPDFFKDYINEI